MTKDIETLGQKIRVARLAVGLNQKDLALAVGVSRSTVCRWEKDRFVPDEDQIVDVARALGLEPEHLFGEDEPDLDVRAVWNSGMNPDAVQELALAVVERAVMDWRELCAGEPETQDMNFAELSRFFKNDCEGYLTGTNLSARKIYNQLLVERARKIHKKKKKAQSKPLTNGDMVRAMPDDELAKFMLGRGELVWPGDYQEGGIKKWLAEEYRSGRVG